MLYQKQTTQTNLTRMIFPELTEFELSVRKLQDRRMRYWRIPQGVGKKQDKFPKYTFNVLFDVDGDQMVVDHYTPVCIAQYISK